MSVSQISVFLENRSGALAEFTGVLSDNKINIQAMSVAETSEFGIVRLISDDLYEAANILKDAGYIARITPVTCVTISDEPGSLHKIIELLNSDGIDVDYMYSYLGGRKENHAHIILKTKDEKKTEALLKASGVEMLEDE